MILCVLCAVCCAEGTGAGAGAGAGPAGGKGMPGGGMPGGGGAGFQKPKIQQVFMNVLSYIPPTNLHAYNVKCAFLGLDSNQLGEEVDDSFHHNFGDNMFPYFKGNTNTNLNYHEGAGDDGDDSEEDLMMTYLNEEDFNLVAEYIPESIVEYLTALFNV